MKNYKFTINGKEYNVAVEGIREGKASVTVNGASYTVDVDGADRLTNAQAVEVGTSPAPADRPVAPKNNVSGAAKVIDAPLPGVIINLFVSAGQAVTRGQKIAVLEAMKMENDILSPIDGTVKEVFVQRGDSVLEGAKIATIG